MDSPLNGALRTFGFGTASLAVHGLIFGFAFAYALPRLEDASRQEPPPIEIAIYEPVRPPEPTPIPEDPEVATPEDEVPPEPETVERMRAAAVIAPLPSDPSNGATSSDAVQIIEPPQADPATEPAEVLDPEAERRRMMVLLDPRNAARSSFTVAGPGPSRRGPPAERGMGTADRGPTEREIEQRMASGLRSEALTKRHVSHTRPELQRQTDGSYTYSGHRFEARVLPDGRVAFADRPGISTNGFSASGSFDLTDAIMGASGQDPYLAEREWFMRHTQDLRDRLEAAHRRTETSSGLRLLRGRLERIWSTTSRSTEARRRRIFDVWDEMAEDESGVEGRDIVVRFVRETMPQGSEDAFGAAELDRLNASRESRTPFAPY